MRNDKCVLFFLGEALGLKQAVKVRLRYLSLSQKTFMWKAYQCAIPTTVYFWHSKAGEDTQKQSQN